MLSTREECESDLTVETERIVVPLVEIEGIIQHNFKVNRARIQRTGLGGLLNAI
jgi:hypothetical protein